MSKFYGTVEGSARSTATRVGSAKSGITTHAASWSGAVRVDVFEREGKEHFEVSLVPWHGRGRRVDLVCGVLGDES